MWQIWLFRVERVKILITLKLLSNDYIITAIIISFIFRQTNEMISPGTTTPISYLIFFSNAQIRLRKPLSVPFWAPLGPASGSPILIVLIEGLYAADGKFVAQYLYAYSVSLIVWCFRCSPGS